MFLKFDLNGDDFISQHEMTIWAGKYEYMMAESEISAIIITSDKDGDHKINLLEFKLTQILHRTLTSETHQTEFDTIDIDNNDEISLSELRAFAQKVSIIISEDDIIKTLENHGHDPDEPLDINAYKRLFTQT